MFLRPSEPLCTKKRVLPLPLDARMGFLAWSSAAASSGAISSMAWEYLGVGIFEFVFVFLFYERETSRKAAIFVSPYFATCPLFFKHPR